MQKELAVRDVCTNLKELKQILQKNKNSKPLFHSNKVLFIDFDGSKIDFVDFQNNDLVSQLYALRNQGLSLCIVTNTDLYYDESREGRNKIQILNRVVKTGCFDLIVDNPLDTHSKTPQAAATSKIDILSTCQSACPEGTEFCYFGSNSELCNIVTTKLKMHGIHLQSQTDKKIPDAQDLKNCLHSLLNPNTSNLTPTKQGSSGSRLPHKSTLNFLEPDDSTDDSDQTSRADKSSNKATQTKTPLRGTTDGPAINSRVEDILSEEIVIHPKTENNNARHQGHRAAASRNSSNQRPTSQPRISAPPPKPFPEKLRDEAGIGKDDHYKGRFTQGNSKATEDSRGQAPRSYSDLRSQNSRNSGSSRTPASHDSSAYRSHASQDSSSSSSQAFQTQTSSSHSNRESVYKPKRLAPTANPFPREYLDELADNALVPAAAETASLPFIDWFRKHFLKTPLISDPTFSQEATAWNKIKVTLKNFFINLFLAPCRALVLIYGFDGYDPISNTINYADGDGKPEDYHGNTIKKFSPKLFLASFFGLPSRPIMGFFGGPTITWKQLGKNFLGGIDWNDDTPFHKKLLQAWGSPIKLGILLSKIVTMPFKLAINIIKLGTEFVPWIASSLSYFSYNFTKLLTQASWWGLKKAWSKGLLALPFIIILALTSLALALATVALVATHFACRLLMIIGRAITSPENGLRMAYAAVSELKLPFESEVVRRRMAKFLGGLAATISIAITIVTWAIFFPLLINFMVNFVPTIASWVITVINWQPIATIITGINVPFTALTGFLHSIFGPAIAALTTIIGVQITLTAIVTAVLTPMLVGWGYFTNYLSNRWNNWHEGGIFGPDDKMSKLFPLPKNAPEPRQQGTKHQSSLDHQISSGADDLTKIKDRNFSDSARREGVAVSRWKLAEDQDISHEQQRRPEPTRNKALRDHYQNIPLKK
jgi:hypothetical protein